MGNCPSSGTAVCPDDVCTTNPPLYYYDATYENNPCSNACSLPWVATKVAGGLIEAPTGECRLLQNPVDGVTACNNSETWCESNTGGNYEWNRALAWNQASDQSCEKNLARTVCRKQKDYTRVTGSFYIDGNPQNSNQGVQAYKFTMVGTSLLSFFGDFLGHLAAWLGIGLNADQLQSLNEVSMTLTCSVNNSDEDSMGYLFLGDGSGTPMRAIQITVPATAGFPPSLVQLLTTLNNAQFPYTIDGITFEVYFDLYDLSGMPSTGPTFPQPGTVYYVSPARDMIDDIIGLTENTLPHVAELVTKYAQTYRSMVGRGYAFQFEPGVTTYVGFGGLYLLQGPQPMLNLDFGIWNSGSNAANPVFFTGTLLTPATTVAAPTFTLISSVVVHPFTLTLNEFLLGIIVILLIVVLLVRSGCR